MPGDEIYWTSSFRRQKSTDTNFNTFYILGVDVEFAKAYDLKVVAGRNFEITNKTSAAERPLPNSSVLPRPNRLSASKSFAGAATR